MEAIAGGNRRLDFQCEKCNKQFNKRHSLKIHIERVHEKKLKHSCSVCQKSFFYMKDLVNHMKVHNLIEKPHIGWLPENFRDDLEKDGRVKVNGFDVTIDLVCLFCFKILGTAASTKYHQRLHLDEKKHRQLMEAAAFELEQGKPAAAQTEQNVSPSKSQLTNVIQRGSVLSSQKGLFVKSEALSPGKSGPNFFFTCATCPVKFLSTKLLRNHICGSKLDSKLPSSDINESSNDKIKMLSSAQNKTYGKINEAKETDLLPKVSKSKEELQTIGIPGFVNGAQVVPEQASSNENISANSSSDAETIHININSTQQLTSRKTVQSQRKKPGRKAKPGAKPRKKSVWLYCDKCDFRTQRFFYIRKHNRTHLKKPTKSEPLLKEDKVVEAQIKEENGAFYKCDSCKYKAAEIGFLRRHINMQHDNMSYHCYECDFKATLIGELANHCRSSHDQPMHCCLQCVYHTEREDHLRRHIRSRHKTTGSDQLINWQNVIKSESSIC